MDDVDENLHATLEVSLDQGVNERLKPEESENDHRIGNHLEDNNLEGNHLEGNNHQIQDHFHQEEMSEGSEVGINTITSLPLSYHHYDDDDVDDDEDEYDDDN